MTEMVRDPPVGNPYKKANRKCDLLGGVPEVLDELNRERECFWRPKQLGGRTSRQNEGADTHHRCSKNYFSISFAGFYRASLGMGFAPIAWWETGKLSPETQARVDSKRVSFGKSKRLQKHDQLFGPVLSVYGSLLAFRSHTRRPLVHEDLDSINRNKSLSY